VQETLTRSNKVAILFVHLRQLFVVLHVLRRELCSVELGDLRTEWARTSRYTVMLVSSAPLKLPAKSTALRGPKAYIMPEKVRAEATMKWYMMNSNSIGWIDR
jgi:hypothetical protein